MHLEKSAKGEIMENNREVAIYDELSSGYEADSNLALYYSSADEIINIINKVKWDNVDVIIDLCCGSGILTERLQRVFSEADITGYDVSSKMLDLAKAKKNSSINYELQDVDRLEVIDFKADIITCNYGVHWLKRETISKIAKGLKKGGLFICSLPGYALGRAKVSKEGSNYVGNMNFNTILTIASKYKKYSKMSIPQRILGDWSSRLDHVAIKAEMKANMVNLLCEEIKTYLIDFNSSDELVSNLLSRGTYGDVFIENSSEFINDLILHTEKLKEIYHNLTEENITQYLIFQK